LGVALPGDPTLAAELMAQLQALPAEARAALLGAVAATGETLDKECDAAARLNHRFDLFVLKPGADVPYVVLTLDGQTGHALLAGLRTRRPTVNGAARAAARAWGVPIRHVEPRDA
jgi:hypothetical protein